MAWRLEVIELPASDGPGEDRANDERDSYAQGDQQVKDFQAVIVDGMPGSVLTAINPG